MIGGKPHPALGIEGHILEQHLVHQRRHHDAHGSQEAGSAHKPFLLSLTIDIGTHIGSYPVVALVIYKGKRKLIGRKMMRGDEAILPYHLLCIAVEAVDAAINKGDQRLPPCSRMQLTWVSGKLFRDVSGKPSGRKEKIGSLMLDIYEIDTLAIHADPHILLESMKTFWGAPSTPIFRSRPSGLWSNCSVSYLKTQ